MMHKRGSARLFRAISGLVQLRLLTAELLTSMKKFQDDGALLAEYSNTGSGRTMHNS